jgi:RNA-binding motif protein, X-linked 2
MNKIRQIAQLNARELEHAIPPSASWHADYRDTSTVFVGGLDTRLSEGDVLTIFSQYGEPVWLRLARDRDTGKSKGFGWLRYEDQRSCDLAIDNLGGAEVLGRKLGVDHARYKKRDDEDMNEGKVPVLDGMAEGKGWGGDKKRERGRRKSDTPLMLEEDHKAAIMEAKEEDQREDAVRRRRSPTRSRSPERNQEQRGKRRRDRSFSSRSRSPPPRRRRGSPSSSDSERRHRRRRSR